MKKILLVSLTILLIACQTDNAQEITPELAKIAGKWQLYKIGYGFPPPNGPTETTNTNQEIVEFNSSNATFSRTISGKISESGSFELKQLTEGGSTLRDAVVFKNTNTYSFITFEESTSSLILYQSAPIGAVLADGNSFFYQKIK
jgi:hypothetical protein